LPLFSRNIQTMNEIDHKDAVRFWSHVDQKEADSCWNWKAAVDRGGYGKFKTRLSGKKWDRISSRVAWFLTYGKIERGLCVLHRCDNPRCCNPAHMFLGTNKDNFDDMMSKGRFKPSYGMAGKIFITNGTENRVLKTNEDIPEGWTRGLTKKSNSQATK
jgi:hypothetical protein